MSLAVTYIRLSLPGSQQQVGWASQPGDADPSPCSGEREKAAKWLKCCTVALRACDALWHRGGGVEVDPKVCLGGAFAPFPAVLESNTPLLISQEVPGFRAPS